VYVRMLFCNPANWWACIMYKVCSAFIVSISVLASNQALAQSGAALRVGSSASTHQNFQPIVNRPLGHRVVRPLDHRIARPLHHRIGRNVGAFFPTTGPFFWGIPNAEALQPVDSMVGDFNYTYKYDVPWDWAHRYPPSFFASPPEPPAPPIAYRPG